MDVINLINNVFISRIFINKVLSITKAVVNYDHYLLQSLKASSKLNRVSLGPKRNNMFISFILMMAHCCNWLLILFSNMVLSRVTLYWSGNVTPCYYMDRLRDKKINNNKKNIALNLKMNQSPRLSKRELAMVGD